MSAGRVVRTTIVVGALVVLQFALEPLMPWRVSADFLVIALLYGAVRMRPGAAAILGFSLGLVTDSLTLGGFGAGALALTVVGFAASWLKALFFADNLALNAFFLFLGKWAFDLLYVVAMHNLSLGAMLAQLFVWSVLSAAVTAAAGVVLMAILRPLDEARHA